MDPETVVTRIWRREAARGALGAGSGAGVAFLMGATPVGVVMIAVLGAALVVVFGRRGRRRD